MSPRPLAAWLAVFAVLVVLCGCGLKAVALAAVIGYAPALCAGGMRLLAVACGGLACWLGAVPLPCAGGGRQAVPLFFWGAIGGHIY